MTREIIAKGITGLTFMQTLIMALSTHVSNMYYGISHDGGRTFDLVRIN